MNIPQEVKDRVERVMQLKMDNADYTEAIIEAAQLPIAPATYAEKERSARIYIQHQSASSNPCVEVLSDFISRRNALPPVDPLEEIIKQEICKGRDAGQTIAETAKKIAAAVREAKNG